MSNPSRPTFPEMPAPPASSAAARKVMLANRGADTKPEVALRSALHRRGLRFRKHLAPVASLRCRADIVFRPQRIAVFVDGCFWHRCPEHATFPRANGEWWRSKLDATWERDRRNDALLQAAGWTVIRVWEHEAPETAAQRIAEAVARACEGRGTPPPGSRGGASDARRVRSQPQMTTPDDLCLSSAERRGDRV